jgi:hypothetical protein
VKELSKFPSLFYTIFFVRFLFFGVSEEREREREREREFCVEEF